MYITPLGTFPNYEDYKNLGREAYAIAVREWLAKMDPFSVELSAAADEVEANAATVENDKNITLSAKQAVLGSVNYKGDYVVRTYALNESVTLGNTIYVSKIDDNTDTPPSSNWFKSNLNNLDVKSFYVANGDTEPSAQLVEGTTPYTIGLSKYVPQNVNGNIIETSGDIVLPPALFSGDTSAGITDGSGIETSLITTRAYAKGDVVVLKNNTLTSSGSVTLTQNNYHTYTGGGVAGTVGNMYLYTGTTTTADISTFDFTSGSFTDSGASKDIYQCILNAPIGTSLVNTIYFQTLDQVTTQDPVFHRYLKSNFSYSKYTFRGTHTFTASELSNPYVWASYYFGSPIANNLWEDDLYYYIPIKIFQRFNAGIYNPIENPLGTKATKLIYLGLNNRALWHQNGTYGISDGTSNGILETNSTYEAFDVSTWTYPLGGDITETSFRADGAFYNAVYINQAHGEQALAYRVSIADITYQETMKIENDTAGGSEGMVETFGTGLRGTYSAFMNDTSIEIYMPYKTVLKNFSIDEWITIQNTEGTLKVSFKIFYLIEQSDNPNDLVKCIFNSSNHRILSGVNPNGYFECDVITKESKYCFNQEIPHVDVIGSFTNYWQVVKDRLASGKSVLMNPLLMDDSGNSLLPNGVASQKFKLSKKGDITHTTEVITRADLSDTTWSAETNLNRDSILNHVESIADVTTTKFGLIPYTAKTASMQNYLQNTQKYLFEKVFSSNHHTDGANAVATAKGFISTSTDASEQLTVTKIAGGIVTHTASGIAADAIRIFSVGRAVNGQAILNMHYDYLGSIDITDTAFTKSKILPYYLED